MSMSLSPDTQAILLLTAPLIAGRGEPSADPLTQTEYKRLVRFLRERNRQPSDLLGAEAQELIGERQHLIESDRLKQLLARGFLLSQAVERWQARAIWVVSSADAAYPGRLRMRLKDDAPPVLYGCGEASILDTGGLAVVGSRQVDEVLVAYTEDIGQLAARAHCTVVSGGARGLDQSAMSGALEAGGKTIGVLADSLERAALNREHRTFLMEGQLVLISPFDPSAGFNVGHAMRRNKLIYALADAALVVNSDYEKGGTWAGALEQLEKLQFVPVYVRSNGETSDGIKALRHKGALPWPNPETPEALADVLVADVSQSRPEQNELFSSVPEGSQDAREIRQGPLADNAPSLQARVELSSTAAGDSSLHVSAESASTPAAELFAKVRELLGQMKTPRTDAEIAADLQVSKSQAKEWLQRLVKEGVLKKYTKPVRYGPKSQNSLLD
jgi:predicted Rossmann fold nucleotide-binding protein DprA/Smf involved in DNA uptake